MKRSFAQSILAPPQPQQALLLLLVDSPPPPHKDKRQRRSIVDKIISGAQTGADRAALEAAEEMNIETGGTVPTGFRKANEEMCKRFKLTEVESNGFAGSRNAITLSYIARSKQNVDDSDATLAFRFHPSPGTDKTIGYCLDGNWAFSFDKAVLFQQHSMVYSPCGPPPRSTLASRFHKPFFVISKATRKTRECVRRWIQSNNIGTLNVCGNRDKEYETEIKAIVREILREEEEEEEEREERKE